MVTSVDLIQEQIRVAAGEPLSVTQEQASAARARDRVPHQRRGSRPRLRPDGRTSSTPTSPPGGPWTRVDSHCYPGWTVSPFYDSLIAKLIVWAPDRPKAIDRMERALAEFDISGRGVKTTIPFHRRILAHAQFRSGDVTTDFVEHFMAEEAAAAAAAAS